MLFCRRFVASVFIVVLMSILASAQTAPPPTLTHRTPTSQDNKTAMMAREFGPRFTLLPEFPVMAGDLDGDGKEDLVFIVTGQNPLLSEGEFGFKVIDPYNSFFGYGNPKITMSFGTLEPGPTKYVLILHNWQADVPKTKFVIVNLPFTKLELGTIVNRKKKPEMALEAQESGGINSIVFWDGKKYKWEVMGESDK
jgi:hypothetical protein